MDFDNYANFQSIGRRANQRHVTSCLNQLISYLGQWNKDTYNLNELTIRFYGGWYINNSEEYSDRYNMLSAALYNAPKIEKKCRLKFIIADHIAIAPHKHLLQTVKTQPLNKVISISDKVNEQCPDTNCPIYKGLEAAANGCPTPCNIKPKHFFSVFEQKTVDTSLVIDIAHYTHNDDFDMIGVVSGDYDMIPGLIYASESGKDIFLFRNKEQLHFDIHLDRCKIETGCIANYAGGL
ncbi:NYN domain-containing protein [Maridesulfovibrio sp.]|uniref:NYN domain-containing protein n=1 Tax=Maridesulfovibrio sp. TaxID=2795000 RepID=UPI003B007039